MIRRPAKWDILSTRRRENTNGLVYWGTFQDGTAMDWSGNQNNGTLIGAPAPIGGINGNALNFNTSQSVSITNTVNLGNAFALCCWFYATAGGGVNPLISNTNYVGGGSSNGWSLYLNLYTTNNHAIYFEGRNSSTQYANTNTGIFNVNQWYHCVVNVTDKSSGAIEGIYLNGISQTLAQNTTATNYQTSSPIRIGGQIFSSNPWYVGNLDDVRIYNRSLSPGEINAIYNQTLAAANQPEGELPIAWYSATTTWLISANLVGAGALTAALNESELISPAPMVGAGSLTATANSAEVTAAMLAGAGTLTATLNQWLIAATLAGAGALTLRRPRARRSSPHWRARRPHGASRPKLCDIGVPGRDRDRARRP